MCATAMRKQKQKKKQAHKHKWNFLPLEGGEKKITIASIPLSLVYLFFLLLLLYSNWTYFSVMALFKPIRCRQKSTIEKSYINCSAQGEFNYLEIYMSCDDLWVQNSLNRKIFENITFEVCVTQNFEYK